MTWYNFTAGTDAKADEVNDNFKYVFNYYRNIYYPTDNVYNVIGHSATHISVIDANWDIYNTTDGGATWTSENTDLDDISFTRNCKANRAYAIAIETTSLAGETIYTVNSGETWTLSGNTLTMASTKYDLSYPTTSLIVAFGADGNGTGVGCWWLAAGGGAWTQSLTGTVHHVCGDMFDGTTGYSLDQAGNVWKTVDNAVNWDDTTDNINSTVAANINQDCYAMSATKVLFVVNNATDCYIEVYDNTAHTSTTVAKSITTEGTCRGIVRNASGEMWVAISDHGADEKGTELFYSNDDFTTCHSTLIGWEDTVIAVNTPFMKFGMSEAADDQVLLGFLGTQTIWGFGNTNGS